MSRMGSNRQGADGARVENVLRIHHYIAHCSRDPEHDDWNTLWTWAIPRTDHLHVNVQQDCMVRKRKRRFMFCEFQTRTRICKKTRARTLVVSRAWIREEVVRNSHVQTEWKIGSCRWGHDAQLQRKWTPSIPWIQCFGTRKFEKSKGKGKLSIHFCGDEDTAELVLRTNISVNRLSIFGAVADLCKEPDPDSRNQTGQQNCRQRTKRLGSMTQCKETCCTITNKNSQFFQIIFDWSNCAPM